MSPGLTFTLSRVAVTCGRAMTVLHDAKMAAYHLHQQEDLAIIPTMDTCNPCVSIANAFV